jgi:FkbM family methyltransferase
MPLCNALLRFVVGGDCFVRFRGTELGLWVDGYKNLHYVAHPLEAHERGAQAVVEQLFRTKQFHVAWDIGANVGFWSVFFHKVATAPCAIVAYEPDEGNLTYLRRNITANRIPQCTVRGIALSGRVGKADFYSDSVTGFSGSLNQDYDYVERTYHAQRSRVLVQVSTMDDEIRTGTPPPGFMKIDVEGHELSVLQGGLETIRQHCPIILLELHRDHEACAEFLRFIGYAILDLGGKEVARPKEVWTWLARPRSRGADADATANPGRY